MYNLKSFGDIFHPPGKCGSNSHSPFICFHPQVRKNKYYTCHYPRCSPKWLLTSCRLLASSIHGFIKPLHVPVCVFVCVRRQVLAAA